MEKRQKNERKGMKILLRVCFGILLAAGALYASFEGIRAIGRENLKKKASSAAPLLVREIEQEVKEQAAVKEEEKWQEGWVRYEGKIYAYNEDIRTFLFMGIDKNSDVKEVKEGTNGGQADALFLAVMNPHKKSIQVIGINRNTMTDIDVYDKEGEYVNTTKAQIAVQHGFGNGMEESCEYQMKAVTNLFYNLPVHGYAAINMSAIATINDAVGGVSVNVLEDLTQADKKLVKGADVHLMGKTAFWYVKYRNTKEFGSADMRLARQKQYLNGFINEAKKAAKKDITVALDLYQAVIPQMVTNITLDEVAYLAPILADYDFNSENFFMIEGETVMGERFEEFYADEDALYKLILEVFYEEVADK